MNTLLSTYNSLKAARAPWESWWDTLRHYVLPSRLHEEPTAGISWETQPPWRPARSWREAT